MGFSCVWFCSLEKNVWKMISERGKRRGTFTGLRKFESTDKSALRARVSNGTFECNARFDLAIQY